MDCKEYKKIIEKQMKAVGTFKKEFSIVILTLSQLMEGYDKAVEKFEQSGGNIIIKHTNKAKEANVVKNPFYLAIETMRMQILKYLAELGLTPSGLKKINEKSMDSKKESTLAKALMKLG